jgi:hypothetical protein
MGCKITLACFVVQIERAFLWNEKNTLKCLIYNRLIRFLRRSKALSENADNAPNA